MDAVRAVRIDGHAAYRIEQRVVLSLARELPLRRSASCLRERPWWWLATLPVLASRDNEKLAVPGCAGSAAR